ncbi:MAG: hypothetical protein K2Y37_05890 [Pirellulales bacterium]|nr:hypothetical protein [Pirellulales bacterium]
MATALRYLPVFASALVLSYPQAFCCCLWASPAASAPEVTCCAKLAGKGSGERARLGQRTPCEPGLRCCGQGISALPEKPVTQADQAHFTPLLAVVIDRPLVSVIAAASSQAESVLHAGLDPPLHVQLCVWRC